MPAYSTPPNTDGLKSFLREFDRRYVDRHLSTTNKVRYGAHKTQNTRTNPGGKTYIKVGHHDVLVLLHG